jgi:lipoprotein-releasing system ATP-binding protein
MAELIVENISKQFPAPGEPLKVLKNVSFTMSGNQSMAILGSSGSGKSTLLHVLGTLESPSSGKYSLDGIFPAELNAGKLSEFRNEKIGFIFQDHHLLPQLSARENVLIPALAHGVVSDEKLSRADYLLERVGLKDRADYLPAEMSGGQRQRVAIARSMLNSPVLLLADEPTGNLDSLTSKSVGELMVELNVSEGFLMVCVTHDQHFAKIFDSQVQLIDGVLEKETHTQDA